jgi:hypothetical protein
MNTDYHPPNANKHVETTGEPEGARSKRRRGPDGAAVDGGSGDVGLSTHGVEEANTRSRSAGTGRPVHGDPFHGEGETSFWVERVGDVRPVREKEGPAFWEGVMVSAAPSAG